MRQYLITSDEVSTLARGMSIHVEQEKIETYIRESEDIDIKSAIGDALFIDIQGSPEKYELLLNGGVYEDKNGKHVMTGLKTALAYYAYARLVKNGDGHVTAGELYRYIYSNVSENSKKIYQEQIPCFYGDDSFILY